MDVIGCVVAMVTFNVLRFQVVEQDECHWMCGRYGNAHMCCVSM